MTGTCLSYGGVRRGAGYNLPTMAFAPARKDDVKNKHNNQAKERKPKQFEPNQQTRTQYTVSQSGSQSVSQPASQPVSQSVSQSVNQ